MLWSLLVVMCSSFVVVCELFVVMCSLFLFVLCYLFGVRRSWLCMYMVVVC